VGYPACTSDCNDCAGWSFILCSNGTVQEIFFVSVGLTGTIPSVIGEFSQLQDLDLHDNNLSGTIPSEIGMLSQLTFLYLDVNNLNGTIPSEIGKLSQLQTLALYSNNLNGSISSEIGNLSQLTFLDFGTNKLTGTIPSEIGELSNLQYLFLSNNKLSGEIPFQLQNLGSLSRCNVWFGNDLICDPTYPPGVTRCMGTQSYLDNNGEEDAPNCTIPSTSSTIPSTSSGSSIPSSSNTSSSSTNSTTIDCGKRIISSGTVVSFTVTWNPRFANARTIRVQFRVQTSKPGNWECVGVDGTKVSATIAGLKPNTVYEYRFVVIDFDKSTTVTAVSMFTTPSS